MKQNIIFVTGFFGAPVIQSAERLAKEKGYAFLSLDAEIEKDDGRSIQRICMMMGEHEYRNKEYAALLQIVKSAESGLIVCCGDGVLLDDMSKDLIKKHSILVIGTDLPKETLWQNAKKDKSTYHAFMHFGTEEKRRTLFNALWEKQRVLFAPLMPPSSIK